MNGSASLCEGMRLFEQPIIPAGVKFHKEATKQELLVEFLGQYWRSAEVSQSDISYKIVDRK